jgi:hypothetical protein
MPWHITLDHHRPVPEMGAPPPFDPLGGTSLMLEFKDAGDRMYGGCYGVRMIEIP